MGIELNASDVFEMAEQIEKDASRFYQLASMASAGPSRSKVLLHLAEMETDHEHIFSAMKTHLSAEGWTPANLDLPDTDARHASAMLRSLVSGVKQDLANRFTGGETPDEVLRTAIAFEKDSIVFFLSMKQMLSEPADRKRIDGILKEELGHVLSLSGELASSQSSAADA